MRQSAFIDCDEPCNMTHPRADEILHYWFGRVEQTILPSDKRSLVWFGACDPIDEEIKTQFSDDLTQAEQGAYDDWKNDPRACLALILIFDQFPRRIYRNCPEAFRYDARAHELCLYGLDKQYDHELSLVERVFFYFPLLHAEDIRSHSTAVHAYQMLLDMALPETRQLFRAFWNYAVQQYNTIKTYGRFPERNAVLGRESTVSEQEYLARLRADRDV